MGVLDGGADRRTGMGSSGAHLGHHIVAIGTLLHSCARVMHSSQITLGRTCSCCCTGLPSGASLLSCLQCFDTWLGSRKGIWPAKNEWWDVGVVVWDEVQTCI